MPKKTLKKPFDILYIEHTIHSEAKSGMVNSVKFIFNRVELTIEVSVLQRRP